MWQKGVRCRPDPILILFVEEVCEAIAAHLANRSGEWRKPFAIPRFTHGPPRATRGALLRAVAALSAQRLLDSFEASLQRFQNELATSGFEPRWRLALVPVPPQVQTTRAPYVGT